MSSEEKDEEGVAIRGDSPGSVLASDVIDAFGTLSISDRGISRFFGPTGGSEVCSIIVAAVFCVIKSSVTELIDCKQLVPSVHPDLTHFYSRIVEFQLLNYR